MVLANIMNLLQVEP